MRVRVAHRITVAFIWRCFDPAFMPPSHLASMRSRSGECDRLRTGGSQTGTKIMIGARGTGREERTRITFKKPTHCFTTFKQTCRQNIVERLGGRKVIFYLFLFVCLFDRRVVYARVTLSAPSRYGNIYPISRSVPLNSRCPKKRLPKLSM
jgi:hypothetical protein